MWRTVADLTNKSKQKPPRLILCDNTMTTSLKKISNYANNHFINKIAKLRESFTNNFKVTHIDILNQLVPKNSNKFRIKKVTHNDIKNIIKRAKSTNATGNDLISMKTIKKLSPNIMTILYI